MEHTKDPDYRWTNEKHLRFLSAIQASFVKSMLGNNDRFPRVDRYSPGDFESTLDSKHTSMERRRRRHSTSDILDSRLRSSQRTTRLPLNQSSQDDQVVPQIEKAKNNEEAERDGQIFAMRTTASST